MSYIFQKKRYYVLGRMLSKCKVKNFKIIFSEKNYTLKTFLYFGMDRDVIY